MNPARLGRVRRLIVSRLTQCHSRTPYKVRGHEHNNGDASVYHAQIIVKSDHWARGFEWEAGRDDLAGSSI
ncbi:hypothetical protein [Phyllobacterium sp. K27]